MGNSQPWEGLRFSCLWSPLTVSQAWSIPEEGTHVKGEAGGDLCNVSFGAESDLEKLMEEIRKSVIGELMRSWFS